MGNRSAKSHDNTVPINTDDVMNEVVSSSEEETDNTENVGMFEDKTHLIAKMDPKALFDKYDEDGNEQIDFSEFQTIFKDLKINIPEVKLRVYFQRCDKTNRGTLNFDEFYVAMFTVHPLNTNRAARFSPGKFLSPRDIFTLFDLDKSNAIDRVEFSDMLRFMNYEMPLDKQEYYFCRFEDKETETLTYENFRQLWFTICDPTVELASRNAKFNPKTPRWMLIKKLERIVLHQEEMESKSFTEAEWWHEWAILYEKRQQLIKEAKNFANIKLADAIDVAGQVYVFGTGPFGRFDGQFGERDHLDFERFDRVVELWTSRVQPEKYKLDVERKEREEREEDPFYEETNIVLQKSPEDAFKMKLASSIDNPFFSNLHVCINTAWLWGRGVCHVSIGGSVAYALTDLGDMYCWGGNTHRWKYMYNVNEGGKEVKIGDVTPRSQLLKMSTQQQLEKDKFHQSIDLFRHTYANSRQPNPIKIDENELAYGIVKIGIYYHIRDAIKLGHSADPQKVLKVLEPLLDTTRIRISLQLRGIPLQRKSRDEQVFILGQCLLLEVECKGEEFHQSMQRMDEKINQLLLQQEIVAGNKLIRSGARRWRDLRVMQSRLTAEESKLHAIAKKEWQQVKELKFRSRDLMKSRALEYGRVSMNQNSIPVSGLTARGPRYKYPIGTHAVMTVSVGARHAVAIHQTGRLYSWGVASFGRLGTKVSPLQTDTAKPRILETVKTIRFQDVSCGFSHSAAVSSNGELYMWGSAASGKLGLSQGNDQCYATAPAKVNFLAENVHIRRVACGAGHTIALTNTGRVYSWGCGDGGRLGLGDGRVSGKNSVLSEGNLCTVSEPRWVESLKDECVVDVSCGISHSALVTASKHTQEGFTGGDIYVAGSAHALGRFTPQFTIVKELKRYVMRQVSCGTSHTAAVSIEGELYTWGSNATGCTGHPTKYRQIRTPKLVRCMYRKAHNIALLKSAWQSTIEGDHTPDIGVNGTLNAYDGQESFVTLREDRPVWQVDLGEICTVDQIRVYSRLDKCHREEDTYYRDRSFPIIIFVSKKEIVKCSGQISLREGRTCSTFKKFTDPSDSIVWDLPHRSHGRYVRIQLLQDGILNFSQVEVYGRPVTECRGPLIHRISCGDSVTIAISRPIACQLEIDRRYIEAVRADADNRHILRQYHIFRNAFKTYGDCSIFHGNCPLCTKRVRCALCALLDAFPKDKLTDEMRHERALVSLSEALVELENPKGYTGEEADYESDEEDKIEWKLKHAEKSVLHTGYSNLKIKMPSFKKTVKRASKILPTNRFLTEEF